MRINLANYRFGILLLVAVMILSACQTTSFYRSENLGSGGKRILLMPVDIELSEMNAGGIKEPKADWTATGKRLITQALREQMAKQQASLKTFVADEKSRQYNSQEIQFVKLHAAVGQAIVTHKFVTGQNLPSKKGKFDWSLGPDVRKLRDKYNADYALFVYVRDSYTSAGRAMAIAVAAVFFGVAIEGGSQQGFASLVDLNNGDVVWINRLFRGEGDLRQIKPARESVGILMANFPK